MDSSGTLYRLIEEYYEEKRVLRDPRQTRRGRTVRQVERITRKLKTPIRLSAKKL